jgi:predicted alpha/beta hydrolase family esterase
MTNVLILHGTDGTPQSNWFMWLKGKLVGRGYHVWLPQLPNAEKPNSKTYTDFLLSNKDFTYDENTVIIGHSSGAVEVLHLLQNLPTQTRIKGAVLVSAFKDDLTWESLSDLFLEPFDFDKIKEHCSKFIFIHSDDDPYCPIDHAKYLATKTDGELIVFDGQGHFNTEVGPQYEQFPEIIQFIDELLN